MNYFPHFFARPVSVASPLAHVHYENGDKYIGPIDSAGKQVGNGIYEFSDGRRYEGSFVNNHMHGRGRLTTEFGVYEGEMRDAYPEGEGVWYYPSGDELDCTFTKGLANGVGVLTRAATKEPELGFWIKGARGPMPSMKAKEVDRHVFAPTTRPRKQPATPPVRDPKKVANKRNQKCGGAHCPHNSRDKSPNSEPSRSFMPWWVVTLALGAASFAWAATARVEKVRGVASSDFPSPAASGLSVAAARAPSSHPTTDRSSKKDGKKNAKRQAAAATTAAAAAAATRPTRTVTTTNYFPKKVPSLRCAYCEVEGGLAVQLLSCEACHKAYYCSRSC